MFCTKCGNRMTEETKVCSRCGSPVKAPPQSEPVISQSELFATPASVAENEVNSFYVPASASQASQEIPNGPAPIGPSAARSFNLPVSGMQVTPEAPEKPVKSKKSKDKIVIIIAVIVVVLLAVAAVLVYFLYFAKKKPADNNAVTTVENSTVSTLTEPDKSTSAFFTAHIKEKYPDVIISEGTLSFIDNNKKFFPCPETLIASLQSASQVYSYAELSKSIGKYTQKIISVSNVFVGKITESTDGSTTHIQLFDNNMNSYTGYYCGSLPKIFDGDAVTLYGVPVDVVYFENQGGGTTEAILLAICACRKSISAPVTATPTVPPTTVFNEIEYMLRQDPMTYFANHPTHPGAPYLYYVKTKTGSKLNVRESWTTESKVIGTLKNGSDVYMYGMYNGWAYISSNYADQEWIYGWVSAEFITMR